MSDSLYSAKPPGGATRLSKVVERTPCSAKLKNPALTAASEVTEGLSSAASFRQLELL